MYVSITWQSIRRSALQCWQIGYSKQVLNLLKSAVVRLKIGSSYCSAITEHIGIHIKPSYFWWLNIFFHVAGRSPNMRRRLCGVIILACNSLCACVRGSFLAGSAIKARIDIPRALRINPARSCEFLRISVVRRIFATLVPWLGACRFVRPFLPCYSACGGMGSIGRIKCWCYTLRCGRIAYIYRGVVICVGC